MLNPNKQLETLNMNTLSGTIPTRFLTLIAHLTVVIILLWDKDESMQRCLLHYEPDLAGYYQNEYITSLSLSLSFAAVELLGFLTGLSMFSPLHCLFSAVCHCAAAFTWSVSYIDQWDCTFPFYWWIFSFCSTLPFATEFIHFIGFLRHSRR